MPDPTLIIYEDDSKDIDAELQKLFQQTNAILAFLVDRNGQLIASVGQRQESIDITSLASLTAGNIAAAGGMARILGEEEFSILFHEGERENIHITLIGRAVLVVVFDQRSSLGLVRLRVKKSVEVLGKIFAHVQQRLEKPPQAEGAPMGDAESSKPGQASPFSEITEEDIEKLFG